jgi:hypothetical protein
MLLKNIVISIILLAIVLLVRGKNIEKELFEDSKEEKKDTLNYGYLNSFYTELIKEKMTYFIEPLPLQGIEDVPTDESKECKLVYDHTTSPNSDSTRLREIFKDLDKDPVKPFQKLIKANKLKINQKRLNKLVQDCAILSLKLKSIYNRARPYQLCYKYGYPLKYIQSLHADTPSYPSSYALQAYSIAYVLGRKYKKYQTQIEKVANDIAWSRVYSGNNFESDIECSKNIVLNLRIYLESIDI